MKTRKIDIGAERLYFSRLLRDEPSLPPEVSAERLHSFMSLLQKSRRRQCKMTAMQPRLTSQTVRLRQRPLATHMVNLEVKLKVNNRVKSEVEPEQMPVLTGVFVLCERRQGQNVMLSALLD